MYVLHATDSEDAAWRVAHYVDPQLPLNDDETWLACMHFGDKSFALACRSRMVDGSSRSRSATSKTDVWGLCGDSRTGLPC